jgi:outer membrane protein
MKQLLAITILLLCALTSSAFATAPKIGAVFPEIILKESKFAQIAGKKLSDEFAPRRAAIAAQIEAIKQKSAALERDNPAINDQQRLERQREIGELDRAIQKKQHEFQSDLESRKRTEIQTVLDLVNKVVLRIAAEGHYDFIIQNVVYASQAANLTNQVIAEMDKETAN